MYMPYLQSATNQCSTPKVCEFFTAKEQCWSNFYRHGSRRSCPHKLLIDLWTGRVNRAPPEAASKLFETCSNLHRAGTRQRRAPHGARRFVAHHALPITPSKRSGTIAAPVGVRGIYREVGVGRPATRKAPDQARHFARRGVFPTRRRASRLHFYAARSIPAIDDFSLEPLAREAGR